MRKTSRFANALVALGFAALFVGGNGAASAQPQSLSQPTARDATRLTSWRFIAMDANFSDSRPAFSPDGKTVVFERSSVGQPIATLHYVGVSGGPIAPLPLNFLTSTQPDWSSQSNRIAFTSGNGPDSTLWVINPDGKELAQITSPDLSPQIDSPHWMADGKSLVVTDIGGDTSVASRVLRKVTVPPGKIYTKTLTSAGQILAGDATPSPNGRWLALTAQTQTEQPYDEGNTQIFVIDLKASPGTAPILFDAGQGRSPSWSPDGKTIVFESTRDGGGTDYAIYAKYFTGTPADANTVATRLTNPDINAQHAQFSPDGSRLVMAARQSLGKTPAPDGIFLLRLNEALDKPAAPPQN